MGIAADIIQIDSLLETDAEFSQLGNDSLVLFDVDDTLMMPGDAILRSCGYRLRVKLTKKFFQNSRLPLYRKYPSEFLSSLVMLQSKPILVEEESISIIKKLQKRGVCTLAITACSTGKFAAIESLTDWRIDEVKGLGIDFSSSLPQYPMLDFFQMEPEEGGPLFKSGIIFSSFYPKGEVLKQFLETIRWMPGRIVLVDDRQDFLESVADAMEEKGIPFTGFHYCAVKNILCNIDEEVAEFQFKYLAENANWLSDKEAKKRIKSTLSKRSLKK